MITVFCIIAGAFIFCVLAFGWSLCRIDGLSERDLDERMERREDEDGRRS